MTRPTFALACALFVAAWPSPARAYRPFDGTDADVAEPLELEFELQPAGYYRISREHDFVSGGVINFGFAPRFELVLQGFDFQPLDSTKPPLPNRFTDTGVFVKTVWRKGCLQEAEGPSIATELGPLLPTVNDEKGFGAYAGGIVSTCFGESLIVHWNVETQILRQTYDFDLFTGAIIELPPDRYVLRPVAEFFVEHDFGGGQTYSGLVGAIWRVGDKLALDVAFRLASIGGQEVGEARTGFTWTVP